MAAAALTGALAGPAHAGPIDWLKKLKPKKQPACEGTPKALKPSAFLDYVKANGCAGDTPLGRAARVVRELEKTFPNVLPSLEAFGVKMAVSHKTPVAGFHRSGEPKAAKGGHSHPGGGSHAHHGDAAGLYYPLTRLAWADSAEPDAMVAELFHAVDQAAQNQLGPRATPWGMAKLSKEYGLKVVNPRSYGIYRTATDPRFLDIWRKYLEKVRECEKARRRGCTRIGDQGIELPFELFMEVGIEYFATGIIANLAEPVLPRILPKIQKEARAQIHDNFPEVFDYFVDEMARVTRKDKKSLKDWLLKLAKKARRR